MNPIGVTVSNVKVTVVKCAKTVSDQLLKNTLTNLPHTWSTHPSWVADEPYWYWGCWVKGQGHWGQMCQKRIRSITRECLDLPSSNLVHTSILGSRGTLLISGSLGQRSNVPKPFQIVYGTISQNEFLLHIFVQLILNWLIQLYKTSGTKKSLGGIMFYKHLLFISVFNVL